MSAPFSGVSMNNPPVAPMARESRPLSRPKPLRTRPGWKQFAETVLPFMRRSSSVVNAMFASFELPYAPQLDQRAVVSNTRSSRPVRCAAEDVVTTRA